MEMGVKPGKVNPLVRLLKFVGWACVVLYLISVAIDHNELRQLKKENVNLSIEVLKLQLGELNDKN